MFQGRLFSYTDTHRHRLGTNYLHLPVNCPFRSRTLNYQRDGPMTFNTDYAGYPNYFPNSFSGPANVQEAVEHKFQASGDVARYNTADDDNFSQVTTFWTKVLDEPARARLVENIAGHLKNAQPFIQV
jgi:catalase